MKTPLLWTTDLLAGCNVEVAKIGAFEARITCGGAGTIGANVYVGTFAGQVVAISGSIADAESAIKREGMRMLVEAGAVLERSR